MEKEEKERALKCFFGKFTIMDSGCWLWSNAKRYGSFRLNSKVVNAHKASYLLLVGDVPEGKCVLHKCATPGCVNPDHLYLGTFMENTHAMFKRGRNKVEKPGDANWQAKPNKYKYNDKIIIKDETAETVVIKKEQKQLMSVRLSEYELNAIAVYAEKENISKSAAFRLLIRKGIQYAVEEEE